MDSKQLGNFGENIACEYLKQKGYKILDRNYVPKWLKGVNKKEIDIIAKKKDVIYFVEVKALAGDNKIFNPEDKVNFQKKKKIIIVAQNWLMEHHHSPNTKWQLDIISLRIDLENKKAKIKHFENI